MSGIEKIEPISTDPVEVIWRNKGKIISIKKPTIYSTKLQELMGRSDNNQRDIVNQRDEISTGVEVDGSQIIIGLKA